MWVFKLLFLIRNLTVFELQITYWEALAIELKFAVNFWVTRKAVKAEVRDSSGSREPSETRSIAEKVLQGAGSFLHLDSIFDRMSVGRNE